LFTENVNADDVYVVVIIGESARRDRLSILGASRDTTPFLNKEKNLVAFKAKSCNSSTSLSLECMFVHKGGVEEKGIPIQQLVHEGHLFQVFKGLGFSMELFAMQAQVGFYSKVGADSFKIREEIGAEAEKNGIAVIDDLLLIGQLEKSIKRHTKGRHVVVLHQKGSHFLYSSRYPREFAKFQPECRSIDANCSAEEMFNAYDNTILYTDYFIKSVIDQLRDKKAILVYASDHGESIDAKTHFHGTPKHIAPPEQLNIPIMLWASDSLLENKIIKSGFDAAKKHAVDNIVQHEELFESVLGCLGYSSKNGGVRKENNWCANKVNP
jgi:KDO II ethanolaminephosphotransferase